ncbi:MAG: ATP-dependent zinc metalloprotease FtsH [Bacteroidia bacterium]|nr:ATP-dependent zinc metalloprotease FtsH [Bacteroidia bacterium]
MALLFTWIPGSMVSVKETNWLKFEQEMLRSEEVLKVDVINNVKVEVYIKPDKLNDPRHSEVAERPFLNGPNPGPHYYFNIGSVEVFRNDMDLAQANRSDSEKIPVTYTPRKNWLGDSLGWIIMLAIIIGFWFIILRRMSPGAGAGGGSSIFNFGQSKATVFDKDNRSTVSFKDVAGLDEAKTEVKEIVDFLKNPQHYTRLGAKIPKGVILVGPPGTGKTLLAKAVAGEAQVPFFSLSGSEFVEMFVGVGASRVRDLFKKAKDKAPSIIFIDEIDAIGRSRGRAASFGGNDERESTLNQMLTEMDGFGTNTGVIVLAATNRADVLDKALLRPGRFDRHIYLDHPNLTERKEIFKVHLRPLKLNGEVDIDFLAGQTPGFSGADIANVCNEAALISARKKRKAVEKQDFIDAMDRVIGGLEKKSKIITPKEKEVIAYHEAGHATVSWLLPNADPLVKVSIVPRGKALGAAWYLPEEKQIYTTSQFFDRMCAALGGRAAEEVVFSEISSGALDDLEKVTKQAYTMVAYYGLNEKIGNLSYYDSSGSSENSFQKPYSDETAQLIDEEVRALIEQAYVQTIKILHENREGLNKIAEMLLEREVIFKEDVEKILGKRIVSSTNRTQGPPIPEKKKENDYSDETDKGDDDDKIKPIKRSGSA